MEESQKAKRINYVKPEILDLGPVTPAVGGTCSGDGAAPTGKSSCNPTGDWVSRCVFVGNVAGST